MPAHTYTAKDLYGASGRPAPSNIDQDTLGDCYFLAPLGAIAGQQPERIQNAIKYDAKTGNFNVTLFDEARSGKPVTIAVTQSELEQNLKIPGASRRDNPGEGTAPIWPAVLETAFAKSRDSNHRDGLKEGYNSITTPSWSKHGMFALTGQYGEVINREGVVGQGLDKTLAQISQDLREKRPVTLSTDPENRGVKRGLWFGLGDTPAAPQDGLVDNHVYMVEGIRKHATTGEVMVTLRNPWGSNNVQGEPSLGRQPTVEVSLNRLVAGGGFESFNVGAKPGEQPQSAARQTDKASADFDTLFDSLNSPERFDSTLAKLAQSDDSKALRQHAALGADAAEREAVISNKPSAELAVSAEADVRARSM